MFYHQKFQFFQVIKKHVPYFALCCPLFAPYLPLILLGFVPFFAPYFSVSAPYRLLATMLWPQKIVGFGQGCQRRIWIYLLFDLKCLKTSKFCRFWSKYNQHSMYWFCQIFIPVLLSFDWTCKWKCNMFGGLRGLCCPASARMPHSNWGSGGGFTLCGAYECL